MKNNIYCHNLRLNLDVEEQAQVHGYLGENMDSENGIAYRNAEEFLKNLPNISLDSGLDSTMAEDENQGMIASM